MVMCFFWYIFHKSGRTCLKNLDKKGKKLWCFLWLAWFFTLGKDQRFVLNKISLSRYDFSGNSTYVDVKEWPLRLLACWVLTLVREKKNRSYDIYMYIYLYILLKGYLSPISTVVLLVYFCWIGFNKKSNIKTCCRCIYMILHVCFYWKMGNIKQLVVSFHWKKTWKHIVY